MLNMQEIALERQFLIHFIRVAVSRLICCGVNGLYRGDLQLENLMGGSIFTSMSTVTQFCAVLRF